MEFLEEFTKVAVSIIPGAGVGCCERDPCCADCTP